MSMIFGNEPYQEVIDMPDHIRGVSAFRAKNGRFKPDTIVKIFGEQHTYRHKIPQTFDEQAAITRAFLNNELMKDPKNILIMEAPNYMSHNPSELRDTDDMLHSTAKRMASLHPTRVFMTDPRLDGENQDILPKFPNIDQKRRAFDFMKDKMRRTIKEFPELEKVIEEEKASRTFPERGYAVPLLDGYFLDTIQSSRKLGVNPVIYTGDGHRANLVQILSKHPDFTFTGSGINSRKRRKTKKGVDIKIKHPGSLKAFGYESKLPAKERRDALKRAVKEYGHEEVVKKITAISTLNKNKPVGKIFKSDLDYLMKGGGLTLSKMYNNSWVFPTRVHEVIIDRVNPIYFNHLMQQYGIKTSNEPGFRTFIHPTREALQLPYRIKAVANDGKEETIFLENETEFLRLSKILLQARDRASDVLVKRHTFIQQPV